MPNWLLHSNPFPLSVTATNTWYILWDRWNLVGGGGGGVGKVPLALWTPSTLWMLELGSVMVDVVWILWKGQMCEDQLYTPLCFPWQLLWYTVHALPVFFSSYSTLLGHTGILFREKQFSKANNVTIYYCILWVLRTIAVLIGACVCVWVCACLCVWVCVGVCASVCVWWEMSLGVAD